MSRRALAIVALLAGLALTRGPNTGHAEDTPRPAPPLEAVAATWDAGRVEAGTELRHTYELRNRGDRPLQILVTPSCGCTTTDYDHEIAPGAVGKVTALLDTTRVRGRHEKTLSVTTNDGSQPVVTLTIVVDSQRALVVEPDDMPYQRGPAATLKPVELTVRAPDDAPFTITRVEDEPAMRASVAPLDAAAPGGHRRYQLTITPARDLPVGTHHPSVTLVTTAPHADRFALRPTIVALGPLVATPKQMRLVVGGATTHVRVTAADGAAFRLLNATTSDPDFSVDMAAVPGEPAWDVSARYVGKPARRGLVYVMVRITTDAPAQPTLEVAIVGKL